MYIAELEASAAACGMDVFPQLSVEVGHLSLLCLCVGQGVQETGLAVA